MAIELSCIHCESILRIAEQHAGKKARCPSCKEVVDVPAEGAPRAEASSTPESSSAPGSGSETVSVTGESIAPLESQYATPQASAESRQEPTSYAPHAEIRQTSTALLAIYHVRQFAKSAAIAHMAFGGIICLSGVGVVVGWLPIWLGWTLRQATVSIERGVEQDDSRSLTMGGQQLSVFIVLLCVWTLLWMGAFLLMIVLPQMPWIMMQLI